MRQMNIGQRVRGELTGNISTATAFTLYDAGGVAVTLGTKQLIIYAIEYSITSSGAAAIITIFQDLNSNGTVDAGERLAVWNVTTGTGGANNNGQRVYPEGVPVKPGVTPKGITTSAGTTTIILHGVLVGQ